MFKDRLLRTIADDADPKVVLLAKKRAWPLSNAIGVVKILCDFSNRRASHGGIGMYNDEQIEAVLYSEICEPGVVADLFATGILSKDSKGISSLSISSWKKLQ